jgi:hypothetical protein
MAYTAHRTKVEIYYKYVRYWGLQGGDYEECRLLGYKNPVHNSEETNYVSATESSQ